MGKALMDEEGGGGAGFTVVAGEGAGGAREGSDEESDGSSSGEDSGPDPRDEDYDSDEHAELLALGKLMKKHTTRKALLDASYNRYAFQEDPSTLPTWFASDERVHYRPQLPITKAQVEAIKAHHRDIAARPIHKVAEARARKKRRLSVAMDKAKKTASTIMETEEMGARAKAKAVAKAYRQAEAKKVGAKYVVSGANGSKRGPKGAAAKRGGKTRLVDPREWAVGTVLCSCSVMPAPPPLGTLSDFSLTHYHSPLSLRRPQEGQARRQEGGKGQAAVEASGELKNGLETLSPLYRRGYCIRTRCAALSSL
jgi:hypothetical protein